MAGLDDFQLARCGHDRVPAHAAARGWRKVSLRVLVCDDHQIARQGIKQMLADAADIALAGEAADGPEGVSAVRQKAARAAAPDVVLLDIAMPSRDGWTC